MLDRVASQEGLSRAEVIRRLIDRALASQDSDLTADLAAIDEAFGVLGNDERSVRGTGDREEHLARLWRIGS